MGTPQGAVVSPLLANVYLHHVFDLWAEVGAKVAQGDMIVVRYADDLVAGNWRARTGAPGAVPESFRNG